MPHAIFDYQDMIEPMGAGYSTVPSTAPSTWSGTQSEYSSMLSQIGISGGYTKPSPITGASGGSRPPAPAGWEFGTPSGGSGNVYKPVLGTGQGITEGGGFDGSNINMYLGDDKPRSGGGNYYNPPVKPPSGGCPAGYSKGEPIKSGDQFHNILGYQGNNPYTDIRPEFGTGNPRGHTFDV